MNNLPGGFEIEKFSVFWKPPILNFSFSIPHEKLFRNKTLYTKLLTKHENRINSYASTRTRTWMPLRAKISNLVQYPYAIEASYIQLYLDGSRRDFLVLMRL